MDIQTGEEILKKAFPKSWMMPRFTHRGNHFGKYHTRKLQFIAGGIKRIE